MISDRGALAGLVVLDASDHVAGRYAARLFADHGAEVELLEGRPGHQTLGRHAYQPGEAPSGESALFRHLDTGKYVTGRSGLDEANPADHPDIVSAAGRVDVVVVSNPALADAIVDRTSGGTGSGPLVGLVTEFGREGPYVNWQGSELVHQALSGSMFMNGLVGQPPLYGYGMRTSYAAGSYLYAGLVAGLIAAHASRREAAGDGRSHRARVRGRHGAELFRPVELQPNPDLPR